MIIKSIRTTVAGLALLCGMATSHAVPAYPGPLTMKQPDGREIQVRLYGDERGHYYTTLGGEPLLETDGAFRYAVLTAEGTVEAGEIFTGESGHPRMSSRQSADIIEILRRKIDNSSPRHPYFDVRATKPSRTDAGNGMAEPANPLPGLFPGSDFPTIGSPKVLVILVEFADVSFSSPSAPAVIRDQITKRGYKDRGFTGSALDYYADASMNQFTPQFDVMGPVRLSGTQQYYGGNTSYAGGSDAHPREMVVEACKMLARSTDMSQYDNNNDGYIDNVYVIYAGRGEASGGGANTIWPHSWSIPDDMTPVMNGVKLSSYACGNELTASGIDAIGTFCHEFGHVLGLPDLYSTGYNCENHPGGWALMASGSYLNNSRTPPTLSSWERAALGWLKPTLLSTNGEYTLPASLLTTNQAYLISTKHANEYFILENRQFGNEDWDNFVPSWGMLVWHIDYNPNIWNMNIVNDKADHQYANIVEANGDDLHHTSYRMSDCFPSFGYYAFTEFTTPALKAWDGSLTDITIPTISEDDDTLTVTFTTSSRSGVNVVEAEDGITFSISGLQLTVGGADGKRVTVYSPDGRIAAAGTGGTAFNVPAKGIYIVRCDTTSTRLRF